MESMELELTGDDQCESGDDCALNALQVGTGRGVLPRKLTWNLKILPK